MTDTGTNTRIEFKGIERIPPQNLDAERAVLGGMLLEPEASTRAVEIVAAENFYRPAHGRSSARCSRSSTNASRSTS